MSQQRKSESKDRKIQAQDVLIVSQRKELQVDRERIKRLEQALREICDYAEVCQHSPARELLGAAR